MSGPMAPAPTALDDGACIRIREEVLSRIMDGEAVILDLGSGTYFGLDEVGSAIWELFAKGSTVAEIQAKVLELYDVDAATARRDLEALVADLTERGLVEPSE
jgi:DeoR/GlpR family transcriptional regulator of sugar metabolism